MAIAFAGPLSRFFAADAAEAARLRAALDALREAVDGLEGLLPEDMWPLPSYAEMMFDI